MAIKFERLRKIRNSINYYGEEISIDEVKGNSKGIVEMIKDLKKYVKIK